jgi:hypothetical protein
MANLASIMASAGLAVLTTLLLSVACDARSPAGPERPGDGGSGEPVTVAFDFARSHEGWVADCADYTIGRKDETGLVADHRLLPSPLDQTRGALFIGGNNPFDDLFMFWKRRVEGLRPDRSYLVAFVVELATNVPRGIGGIGGSPDTAVFVKAGASRIEPVALQGPLPHCPYDYKYCLSTDKGNQAQSGREAIVLGTMGNLSGTSTWELKELRSESAPLVVTPAADGSVWLLVGTDSGFEGRTDVYYTRVTAQFSPVPRAASQEDR